MKKNWWAIIGIILLAALLLMYVGSRNQDSGDLELVPENLPEIEEPGSTDCTEQQKQAAVCTMDYTPVCGDDGNTYSNACSACSSGNINSYTPGECE